ncbi:MAG: endonuclease/exonuclease/phosphatase family protein [Myxococcota bacterium]
MGYALALVAIALGLRYLGERWWLATVALYLPRIGFGLPLPFITLLVLWKLPRRWLVTQLFALGVWLFPLMGLHLGHSRSPSDAATPITILSFNIGLGGQGVPAVARVLRAAPADIVCLQETAPHDVPELEAQFSDDYFFHIDGQFFIASRFRIEEAFVPPPGDSEKSRFVRYRLRTPRGPIHVYSLHATSPQSAFFEFRGDGLRGELLSGRVFKNDRARSNLEASTAARVAQLRALADDARKSTLPVLIVGDTNSPELSEGFARSLGAFRDAYADVGFGLGYSFPWKRVGRFPFMRIDRILANERVRFLSVDMPAQRASDHLAIGAVGEL